MKPLTLFHTYACLVPFPRGAVPDPAGAVRLALDGVVCFACAEEHGLLSEDERYGDSLAAVHRTDPGGGGPASMLSSLWRNTLCSRCGFTLAQCDLDGRMRRSLLHEGWSPERDADRILRIDDRDAYRAVGRMVRRTVAGEIDAETYERAARLATDRGLPGVDGMVDVWAEASLDDRLRAVAWARDTDQVDLPHLGAVFARDGSDLAATMRAIMEATMTTSDLSDLAKWVRVGWHVVPRAALPPGVDPATLSDVSWTPSTWVISSRAEWSVADFGVKGAD